MSPTLRLDDPLFPPVPKPHAEGMLPLTDGHVMHWETLGEAGKIPLLVLHGGPGGYIKPYYRRVIDQSRFRAIFFDQRGCGQSTPHGDLEANTTAHLVADIERLRRHMKIERWIVFGGSWGSTLGLAYAEQHPEAVMGLVVSGVFLARQAEREWTWSHVRYVYPEIWAGLVSFLTDSERADPRASLLRRLDDSDPAIHGPAAVIMSQYETQLLDVRPDADMIASMVADEDTIRASRIFCHYDRNDFFLAENQLLARAGALAKIPGVIVNGRFDMCTPSLGAFELHEAWPNSSLVIAPVAGHRWNDPPLVREIIAGLAQTADRARR
jgi:proline iminopeptidase